MTRRPAALLALVALCVGCASSPEVQVGATYDPLERFPARATWVWDDARNIGPRDPRVADLGVEAMVREIATAQLAARGYEIASTTVPDYSLSYEIHATSRIRVDGGSFTIGSVSLQLADRETGRRVWVGFARAKVDVNRTEEERRVGLTDAIGRMLEGFPPG